MTNDELDAIEARANAATVGPWTWDVHQYSMTGSESAVVMEADGAFTPPRDADGTFIAHARTDVPTLVAEVRRLRALVERNRDRLVALAARTEDMPHVDGPP